MGKAQDEMKGSITNIVVNCEKLDEALIKANRLVELLREASELICLLSFGAKN